MWLGIYSEGEYLIEKRLQEEEKGQRDVHYATALERVVDGSVGEYRVRHARSMAVLCISRSFNALLEWLGEGLPSLMESVSYGLGVGEYIKSYVSKEAVVVLGSTGLGVFRACTEKCTEKCIEVPYAEIRKIEAAPGSIKISVKNDTGDTNNDTVDTTSTVSDTTSTVSDTTGTGDTTGNTTSTVSGIVFHAEYETVDVAVKLGVEEMLLKEICTLALKGVSGEHLEKQLLFRCISERIWNIVPVYNQNIQSAFIGETETVSFTEDFMLIRENESYLCVPLDMLRKVEITKGWRTKLWIKDANQAVFEYELYVDPEQDIAEELIARIGREEKQFKEAYISVLLDMIGRGAEDIEPDLLKKNTPRHKSSLNASSEYKIYIYTPEKENILLQIDAKERPYFWMQYFTVCGMCTSSGLYRKCLSMCSKTGSPAQEQIDKDVSRAGYEECSGEEEDGLKRVLCAFSVSGHGEYLQSHALIGRVLYRVLGEHGAFLGLCHIFTRILPQYTGPSIYGMQRDVCVLLIFVRERFPGLYENLSGKQIELEMLVTPWVVGLFTTVFSQAHIEQVFDHIARYGAVFVFRLSLALLERMYVQLSRSQGTGSILKAAKEYLFKNGSVPVLSDTELSALLSAAVLNTEVTHDRIYTERQLYELSNRYASTI
ncbi:hypothetical protein NECID01_0198 [Nematocida sp. AWRm77]|nr:hypothetical protein NECID01_0198 [Nematocida sp. AWRm77]